MIDLDNRENKDPEHYKTVKEAMFWNEAIKSGFCIVCDSKRETKTRLICDFCIEHNTPFKVIHLVSRIPRVEGFVRSVEEEFK